jgi:hypothetical protein
VGGFERMSIFGSHQPPGLPQRDPLNEKLAENLLMAKIIEFSTPNKFRKKATWVPPQRRGKLIEFCGRVKKSA